MNYHLHKSHREDTCSTSIRVSPVSPPLSSRACSDSPLQLLRGDLKWYNATQCSHQITSCASPYLTCDSIFLNEDELHSHMDTVHVLNITNPCSNCSKPLPGYHNSSNHLVDDHVTCLHPVSWPIHQVGEIDDTNSTISPIRWLLKIHLINSKKMFEQIWRQAWAELGSTLVRLKLS